MPLDDLQNSASQPVTDQAPAPATAAPATPASPSTPPATPAASPASGAPDPNQMVSNAGPIVPRNTQDPNLVKAVDGAQLPHPAVQRAGLLHSVAQALAGNPTRTIIDDDGTHRTVPVPASSKSLMMAIALEALQGSLTGLAAGRGKGAGQAGLAAMQQAQQQKLQAQQQQEQQAQSQFEDRSKALAQQASAYAANLRTRALAQEVGMRDEASHKEWIAQHASTVAYLRETAPEAIIRNNATEAEITDPAFTREALKNGYTAIPTGYVPRYDSAGNHFSPDGIPLHDNLYMIVDAKKINIPPDTLQKAQSWNLPGFVGWKDKPVNLNDLELNVGSVLDTNNKIASLELEQKDLSDYYSFLASKGVKDSAGKPIAAPDLKQLVQKNPALVNSIVGPWANHFGSTPGAALKAMKDGSQKGLIANLYGGASLLDRYDLLKDLQKKGAEKTLDADIDVQKERNLIPIHAANAAAEAKAKAAVAATSARNEDGSWNPSSIPVALVEADMDPSQLSKRSGDYNAKLQDANQYSLQKYGKPFDIAQAQADYKFANNPGTQNTLRYLNSLTGSDNRSGNLGSLVSLSNKITRTSFPALNDAAGWSRLQTGDPQMVAYYTSITETADQVAKILQGGGTGGGTSDAKLKQAAELFNKGFTKDQIVAVSDTLRSLLANRKTELIGSNRYLQKQFGGGQNPNSGAQAPPVSLLKPGVNTTFANGQVWTIQNGQPVQVK